MLLIFCFTLPPGDYILCVISLAKFQLDKKKIMKFVFQSLLKSYSVTNEMKATEQYFPVALFIILHKVILTLSLWMKIRQCDHSNESY